MKEDQKKEMTRYLGESFRSSHVHAIDAGNNAQLTAIKHLINLAAGGIGLLSAYLVGNHDSGERATLAAIAVLFLSIACGILQLNDDKRYFIAQARVLGELRTRFSLYEFSNNEASIREASDLMKKQKIIPEGREIFYHMQIALFFLAAVVFFMPRVCSF